MIQAPLTFLKDGTIKQRNPFTGTTVWTVPGRGNRPLTRPVKNPQPLPHKEKEDYCAFCEARLLETPPEKSRMIREGDAFLLRDGFVPTNIDSIRAEFRRVPNLYEIVTYDYWQENYGYHPDHVNQARLRHYLESEGGKEHVDSILEKRGGGSAEAYFAGGHDILIARRHFVDNAVHEGQLASSGTLSKEEHRAFTHLAVDSARDLYERNPYVRYVAVFQNWLSAAGASFDHLHKQLVAIDEWGPQAEREISRARKNPNLFNEWGINYAGYHNLIIAENDHAILTAGIGHRYPALNLYSTAAANRPWEMPHEFVDGMSDLVHAAHAAAGPDVPCNEEWHYRPIDVDIPMPWRINIKWRVSTLAGFEGGTKINVNTLSPYDVRDKVVPQLYRLRDIGHIDYNIRIGEECSIAPNRLQYLH